MIKKIKTVLLKAKVNTQLAVMNAAEKIYKKAEKHPKLLAALEGLGIVAVANGINPVVAYAASDPTNTATEKIHQDSGNITISINGNLILVIVGGFVFSLCLGFFVHAANDGDDNDDPGSVKWKCFFWAMVGGLTVILLGLFRFVDLLSLV